VLAKRDNGAVNERKEKGDMETQKIPFTRMMRTAMKAEGEGA
jgi:hypothetical protein